MVELKEWFVFNVSKIEEIFFKCEKEKIKYFGFFFINRYFFNMLEFRFDK